MLNQVRPWALLAAVVLLAGCANPTGTLLEEAPVPELGEEEPVFVDPEELALTSAEPTTSPVVTPQAVFAPNPEPVVVSAPVAALEAWVTASETNGVLWWKKSTVSAEVYNPSAAPLSGVATVTFSKNDTVVETRSRTVIKLAPGKSLSFSFTSTKSADAAQVSVSTD